MGDTTTKTGGSYASTQGQKGTTVNNPFEAARRPLNLGLSELQRYFKSGMLAPNVGTNTLQREGIGGLAQTARMGVGSLNPAIATMGKFVTGGGNVSSADQRRIGNQAMQNSYAEGNLADIAAGKNIGAFDPNYDRLRQRAQENAATEAGMAASGIGRTGSDYHQTAVARQVGDTVAGMDYQRMQDERSRQVEANQLMDAAKQGRLGLGLNAFNSGSAIDAANRDRQMAASGMLPGLIGAKGSLYDMMAGAGDRLQDYQTADRSGKANNLFALLQGLGVAQPYGSQRTTGTNTTVGTMSGSSKEPDNWLGKIIGGIGGIGSLFG